MTDADDRGVGADRIADLLRVAAALRPDASAMAEIVALLGRREGAEPHDVLARDDGAGEAEVVVGRADTEGLDDAHDANEEPEAIAKDEDAETEPLEAEDELDIVVMQRERTTPDVPEWVRAARPLAMTASVSPDAGAGELPALPPLFAAKRTRAVLTGFLAMPGEGEVDVDALIERVARGQTLTAIPRRVRPTLGRGVHVLLDRSDAMMPFLGDIAALTGDLARVAGLGQRIESFVGSPSRGCGTGSRRRWRPFGEANPPPRGSRVVCITDLGLGGAAIGERAADTEEWIAFAATVQRLGCSLGAIVPYEPERWPRTVRRVMALLFWDPSTRASDALRDLLRRAAR